MTTTQPSTVALTAVRPFGWRDKVGYLFGDWGNDFSFLLATMYLMVFYTNVAGLNPAHVGTIFLVARLVDAFTDVGWGHLVDRLKPSATGRFRPWILRMAIPVAVASSLMYVFLIQDWSYGAKLAYAAVTYLLWGSVFYTSINIPYGSMASVVSADPGHRASLSVFRSLGATLAGLLLSFIPPFFLYATIDGQSQVVPENFTVLALVFSAFAVAFYLVCYALVRERVVAPENREHRSFGSLLKSLAGNRALIALMAANLTLLLALLFTQAMTPYLWLNYFNNGALSGLAALLGMLPALALVPFAAGLGRRYGKKEIASVGALTTGAIFVGMYILQIQTPWMFMAMSVLAGFGIGLFNLLVWAFITDVIDHEEVRSGQRDDGTVYAINTWARKLGQALAGGIGGWALAAIGFQAGRPSQSAETIQGIYGFATLAPGILYLVVGGILMFFYPLSKGRLEADVATLAARRAAA